MTRLFSKFWHLKFRKPETPDVALRRTFLVRICLVIGMLVSISAIIRHIIAPLPLPNIIVNATWIICAILTPFLAHRIKSLALVSIPLLVNLFTAIVLAGLFNGGLRAPTTWNVILLPLGGFFFGGPILGILSLIFSIASIGLISWSEVHKIIEISIDNDLYPIYAAILTIFSCIFSLIMAFVFEKARRLYQQETIENSRLSSMGTMAGGIAHEFNNPLAVILAAAERIERLSHVGALNQQELSVLITRITSGADRISRIVEALRIYSARAQEQVTTACNVQSVIMTSIDQFNQRFKDAGISVNVTTTHEPLEAIINSDELHQILMQIVTNAVEALTEAPTEQRSLTVTSGLKGEQVMITVANSGPVIETDHRKNIFVPFFTTKAEQKGHQGLGLNVALGIVSKYGGSIDLDTNTKLTTFVISLPRGP
jgi:signal transduction histidine kinase